MPPRRRKRPLAGRSRLAVQGDVDVRGPAVLLAVLMLAGSPFPVRAQALGNAQTQSSRQLQLWILGDDPHWTARAEGQLSDLPVRVHCQGSSLKPELGQQLAVARTLTASGLVAWLWPSGKLDANGSSSRQGAYLFAWFPHAQRLYVRRVGPAKARSDPSEWSATLEFAALALRTAARAALTGRALGLEPKRVVSPDKPRVPVKVPVVPRSKTASQTRAFLVATADWTLDGQTGSGLLSMGPKFGMSLGPWKFAAVAQVGLPSTIRADFASLDLRRSALAAEFGRRFQLSRTLCLAVQARAGGAWFRRDTRSQSDRLIPAPANTTASGLVGVSGLGHWEAVSHTVVGIELGTDWVPGAPTLQLERDDASILSRHSLWPVQPRGQLSLGAVW